ncbi:unnamed protein product [Arctia plantaginis]|uniref:Uncharacterized protein n=1 Tax=Arctia plantaginis TaxID=874455 RepID=A0A8S0ZC10_ARCPL|nr:unnamed protein product [Arctia plantaginis]
MAAKFVVLALLVAAAQGSAIHGHGADYTSFSYGVSDPHTDSVIDIFKSKIDRLIYLACAYSFGESSA